MLRAEPPVVWPVACDPAVSSFVDALVAEKSQGVDFRHPQDGFRPHQTSPAAEIMALLSNESATCMLLTEKRVEKAFATQATARQQRREIK